MKIILDAKVVFCGNWQNIWDVFLAAKRKKVSITILVSAYECLF